MIEKIASDKQIPVISLEIEVGYCSSHSVRNVLIWLMPKHHFSQRRASCNRFVSSPSTVCVFRAGTLLVANDVS